MPLNPFGRLDTVKMNPGTSPDVIDRPAGPTDPDITILSVQDLKRKPIALFANYSLHYVGGAPGARCRPITSASSPASCLRACVAMKTSSR
jgi:hypothetical protein